MAYVVMAYIVMASDGSGRGLMSLGHMHMTTHMRTHACAWPYACQCTCPCTCPRTCPCTCLYVHTHTCPYPMERSNILVMAY